MADSFFDMREKLARPARAPAVADPASAPLTVSAVTKLVDSAVRRGMPPALLVRGEVSNFSFNRASGHAYFTLKDGGACLNSVMFASEFSRLKFRPTDGMELIAGGSVRVFAAQGKYQLYVNSLQPVGHGALELAFRQLREKLERERLFAAERKRILPAYPRRVAVITSREAAGFADMRKVFDRFPWITVGLFHVPVQGETSGPALAAAVELIGRIGITRGYDLIVLGRGGGSLEDLWGFNHEGLARAIAGSLLPVVTGIGHEVDVSIADLVADHHAHTPTEAGSVAVRGWTAAPAVLDALLDRLHRSARSAVAEARHQLVAIERHDIFRRPTDRLQDLRQQLDHHERSLLLGIHRQLQRTERRLLQLHERLERNAPAQQVAQRLQRVQQFDDRLQRAMARLVRRKTDRLATIEKRLEARSPGVVIQLLQQRLTTATDRLSRGTAVLLRQHRQQLVALNIRIEASNPQRSIKMIQQRIDVATRRLDRAHANQMRQRQQQLDAIAGRLEALSPHAVLRRGYSMTTIKKSGAIVRDASQVTPGVRLVTRVAAGEFESIVEDPKQPKLFE